MRRACRDSIPRTYHYPDLGSAFDWSYGDGNFLQPIRSRTQIWALSSRSDAGKPVLASWAVFSDHLWKRRSCFIIINSRGTQREILRKRPKNNNKAWIKSVWDYFKHFGRLLEKNYLFLTPSKVDGRVPSQQPDLLGSLIGHNSDLEW